MANKSKKVSYAELSRMLYELYESDDVTVETVDEVKGLTEWAEAEAAKRFKKRTELRASGLAKLTDDERVALGFPVAVDDEDFEEDEDSDEDY